MEEEGKTDGRPWDGRLFTTFDKTEIPLFAFKRGVFSPHRVLLLQGMGGRQHIGTGAGVGGAYSGGFFTLFFVLSLFCATNLGTPSFPFRALLA
jgi:hypothetical protein